MNEIEPKVSQDKKTDRFVELLTRHQSRLFAYIHTLTANVDTAGDVLQETNTVLWKKANEFDHNREFLPWAFTIAFNQVRAARTRQRRERLIFHDVATIQAISDDWEADHPIHDPDERQIALEQCIAELSSDSQDLLHRYYRGGESVEQISQSLQRRANTLAVTLLRLRQSLARCIRLTLGPGGLGS